MKQNFKESKYIIPGYKLVELKPLLQSHSRTQHLVTVINCVLLTLFSLLTLVIPN